MLIFCIIYISIKIFVYEFFFNFNFNSQTSKRKSKYTIEELSRAVDVALNHARDIFKTKKVQIISIKDTVTNSKEISFKCILYNFDKLNIKTYQVVIEKPFLNSKKYKLEKFTELVQPKKIDLETFDSFKEPKWFFNIK